MLTNVISGVTVGVMLGAFLTPFSVWAWSRVRLTDWLGFITLAGAFIAFGGNLVDLWGRWSLPVFLVSGVTVFALTRALSLRLRKPEYRPAGVFTFGKAPPGVRDWIRD